MKRTNKSLEIFSLSALDLFASAMGAFVLIAIILFPYYRKIAPTQAEIDALKQSVSELQQQNDQLQSALNDAQTLAFLGIVTKARSFVILIDMSGSMEEYAPLMDKTVAQILAAMDDGHKAQIIGFQGDTPGGILYHWQTPPNLAIMDAAGKQEASRFSAQLATKFDLGTPTLTALRDALTYDAEAIILLSDGAPNTSPPDLIIQEITQSNQGKKEIHTVAIGNYNEQPVLVDFLSNLAKSNGGSFIGVSK